MSRAHVCNVVAEFLADCQQPGAVIGAGNDSVAAQLAAQNLDLGFEEADAGIPARGAGFKEEVKSDAEPAKHSL